MVNPDDLIQPASKRENTLEEYDASCTVLQEEARDGRNRRLFRKDTYNERAAEEVYLPILIVPGVASSGLYVKESCLDKKFEGERLWMNAAFLAKARLNNKVINKDAVERSRGGSSKSPQRNPKPRAEAETETKTNSPRPRDSVFNPFSSEGKTEAKNKLRAMNPFAGNGTLDAVTEKIDVVSGALFEIKDMVKEAVQDEGDGAGNDQNGEFQTNGDDEEHKSAFRKAEEEIAIKNTWIQHIALAKNMVDEKPGYEVRAYDGLAGVEYLVDSAIEKTAGFVMGPLVEYCTTVMGYERHVSIDAMPYDWRLAPSINEKRDGYLTKMIERIEKMYRDNDDLPVVLICHSMGAKMGHYFLNFVLHAKGKEDGRAWLDKHIHTFMPVGAPHGGVGCAVRCGLTGAGLNETVDTLVGNVSDGLIMYRSWSCGNWLMPRMLPAGVFPTCIVRREGELGLTVASEIEVTSLFAMREKKPKELRLTVIFRGRIRAHSDYYPVLVDDDERMVVAFHESFYMAVPYLGSDDDETSNSIGELVFYLEEPAGRVNQNKSDLHKKFSHATRWARGIKKKASKFALNFAKRFGTVLRVAACENPLVLSVSDFEGVETDRGSALANSGSSSNTTLLAGDFQLESTIPMVGCIRQKESSDVIEYSDSEDEEDHGGHHQHHHHDPSGHCKEAIGSISVRVSYSPPPVPTGLEPSAAPIAMVNEATPDPPMKCKKHKHNTISHEKVVYDVWNGTDVFRADGFVEPMFDLVENVYEADPVGPTKESSMDAAPPVNCLRSIYGINTDTEAGAIYRKVPIVTVGDNEADCRYTLDTSATFPTMNELFYDKDTRPDPWSKKHLHGYKLEGGIVYETPKTLQTVPGQEKPRRVCGDGTVPYWNMVHALTWKDRVGELTVDELDGATHRGIVADERFFGLVKRYCRVIDPRANAMMLMKKQVDSAGKGIGSLGKSIADRLCLSGKSCEAIEE